MARTDAHDALRDAAQRLAENPASEPERGTLIGAGVAGVCALVPLMHRDRPIADLEGLEDALKAILLPLLTSPQDGAQARRLASATRELGLTYKYKSYAAKCSTPLGYSVFLQNPRQGFSFQRHVTRKIEIFHIVETSPGALVFLAPFAEWERVFDPGRFASWLDGTRRDPDLDRFRITPQPGDVYVIDELNVVHTVMGCVLEEFATISTDHVERLVDQNHGRPIPPEFTRPATDARLRDVVYPAASCLVGPDGVRRPVVPRPTRGGSIIGLSEGRLFAQRRVVGPLEETACDLDEERARAIHVTAGDGGIVLADAGEVADRPPSIPVAAGDVLLVGVGVFVGFTGGRVGLHVSEQRVSAADALAP